MKRVMTQAINLIFEFLKNKERVQIWLFENTSLKIEGILVVSLLCSLLCKLCIHAFSSHRELSINLLIHLVRDLMNT